MEQSIFINHNREKQFGSLYFSSCGLSQTCPLHICAPDTTPDYILHIIYAGKGCYCTQNQKYLLQPGDAFLIRPNEYSYYFSDKTDPWLYGWLSFGGSDVDEVFKTVFQEGNHCIHVSQTVFYYELILKCLKCSNDSLTFRIQLKQLSYSFLHTFLTEIPDELAPSSSQISTPTANVIEYIRGHLHENLKINDIARNLCFNRSHLSRDFKKNIGMNISEWITAVRINEAATLLATTQYSVEKIAETVGYSHTELLNKAFRKLMFETPTQYRNRTHSFTIRQNTVYQLKELLSNQKVIPEAKRP